MRIVTIDCGGINWTWFLVGVLSGGSIKILAYDRLHNERDLQPTSDGIGEVIEADQITRQVIAVMFNGTRYTVTNPMQVFSYPGL